MRVKFTTSPRLRRYTRLVRIDRPREWYTTICRSLYFRRHRAKLRREHDTPRRVRMIDRRTHDLWDDFLFVTLLNNFTVRRRRYKIIFIIIFTVLFYDCNLSTSSVVVVVVAVTPRRTRACATLLTTGGTVARIRHTNTTHTRARPFGSRARTHIDAGEYYTNKGGRRGEERCDAQTPRLDERTIPSGDTACGALNPPPHPPAQRQRLRVHPFPHPRACVLSTLFRYTAIIGISYGPRNDYLVASLSFFFHFRPLPRSCNPTQYSSPLASQHTAHACAKYNNMHRHLHMNISFNIIYAQKQ